MFSLGHLLTTLFLLLSVSNELRDFKFAQALSTASSPSSDTRCNCVRLSDCESLTWHSLQYCGPRMVCCSRSRLRRNAPWPWPTRSYSNENIGRFGASASTTNYRHANAFDYKDAKTRLNCPWEFYEDPSSSSHNYHHHHHHRHHQHHEHHLTLPAGYDFK